MMRLACLLLAMLLCLPLSAQQKEEQQDSLIWLMSAKSAKMVDVEGGRYRKVIGPARFLHNGTYLICDTALWNLETKIIDAWGNVSIMQEETVLTSDNLKYLIDEDLAKFRGSVVQLTDKDHNTLRTKYLDYNTKDSVAVFKNGASMRDKEGQIIESLDGTYDSKIKKFTFENRVNMFSDSVFVVTKRLIYESDLNLATFGEGTNAWQDDNMLSSERGWYDRGREVFLFMDDVHVMTPDQEGWCDSLYFYRATQDVEMLGNAQITDTTRNVFALAGRVQYQDSLSKITLTRKPAVITQTEEEDGSVDTVYLGSEKLVYYTVKRCDIDSMVVVNSNKRLSDLEVDPVGQFRKKAAEAAAKAAEEEAMKDPNYRARQAAQAQGGRASMAPPQQDTLKRDIPKMTPGARMPVADTTTRLTDTNVLADTISQVDTTAVMDSTEIVDIQNIPDTVAVVPPDTTKIGFLEAIRNVKIYKKDMQVICDSLVYSDLDSLARLFKNPMIWQDIRRQYAADSITIVISDAAMEKASLMSNAFITIQEDTDLFDQIRATEMLAFFDENGELTRFDALGGASALFFIEENNTFATVNKTDSKMLSATFKDGDIERIYYYESPKNDGYPIVRLPEDEKQLKGFNWQPEMRPADRNAVTPLSLRPSERRGYSARPKATFKQTDIYFPGYMGDVYRQIEVRDSLRAVRERERQIAEARAEEKARLDSLAVSDSLASVDTPMLSDSLDIKKPSEVSDSLAVSDTVVASDSVSVSSANEAKVATKELRAAAKAEKKAAREAAKKKKQEKRDDRWAELDKRDAEKAAARAAKRLEKERQNKRKALLDAQRQELKDAETLEKYRLRYEKKKARELARASRKSK